MQEVNGFQRCRNDGWLITMNFVSFSRTHAFDFKVNQSAKLFPLAVSLSLAAYSIGIHCWKREFHFLDFLRAAVWQIVGNSAALSNRKGHRGVEVHLNNFFLDFLLVKKSWRYYCPFPGSFFLAKSSSWMFNLFFNFHIVLWII